MPIFVDFLWTKRSPGAKEFGQKSPELSTRVGGAPIESALYRLEGGGIGDFYELFTEEFASEEIT